MEKNPEKDNLDEEKSKNVLLNNDSAEACYNIIKEEYLHAFTRSDKLDNKVYISLTLCGFIFVFIMQLFSSIKEFNYPRNINQIVLIVLYVVICIIAIVLFLYTLVKLTSLLKPMEIQRIEPKFILENNLQKQNNYTVYTFISVKYVETININNDKLEKRFNQYHNCIMAIIAIVILTFVLNFIKLFL
ncbi:hypothetical protein FDB64_05340 [Clostridium botulinum]|nr:hypothetical protein [Clostridium botulinum]NFM04084.1 hypothetical protein [Clostridium botulinum]